MVWCEKTLKVGELALKSIAGSAVSSAVSYHGVVRSILSKTLANTAVKIAIRNNSQIFVLAATSSWCTTNLTSGVQLSSTWRECPRSCGTGCDPRVLCRRARKPSVRPSEGRRTTRYPPRPTCPQRPLQHLLVSARTQQVKGAHHQSEPVHGKRSYALSFHDVTWATCV